jgi:myo-inositol-1(or 4)-monophosphatase
VKHRVDLQADHALLLDAVRESGAIALDFFRNGVKSWDKRHDDPVSEADIAVDSHLRERLQGTRPDYGWLSEETPDDHLRLGQRRLWIVDPIDGTRAFLKGKPEFTICAALVDEGVPTAAAVFNPATDEFFEAFAGGGARLNGRSIRASQRDHLAGAKLLASRRTFEHHNWLELTPGAEFTDMSSIAYRMAKVADGTFDAAVSLGEKSDWDIAAADLILREAGACCSTREGHAFRFNGKPARHPSVLAAGAALHPVLIEMLARP